MKNQRSQAVLGSHLLLGLFSVSILLATFFSPFAWANSNAALDHARQLRIAGSYLEALEAYTSAVEGDPNDFLALFERSTVYNALGRSKSAIADLDKVIELRPEFTQARLRRASMLFKQGKVDDAKEDYEALLKSDPSDAEAAQQMSLIRLYLDKTRAAADSVKRGDVNAAIIHFTGAIELAPEKEELRMARADCYKRVGDYSDAIADLTRASKLKNDNTESLFLLSTVYYETGQLEQALKAIRDCLKYDSEHKKCQPFYKKMRNLDKQLQSATKSMASANWSAALTTLDAALNTESTMSMFLQNINSDRCKCLLKLKQLDKAIEACQVAVNINTRHTPAYVHLGEIYILQEKFEEAVQQFQQAKSFDPHNQEVHQGLDKAQRLLKLSQTRDYYKILSVSRNADKKEIIKAYRREAVIWHPDKYEGDDKKQAEKRFIDIAAAKEVLTDDNKRAMYDQGQDPLDPETQRQQQQNGFQNGGFNPFGQQFHFRQNAGGGNPFHFNF